MMYVLAYDGILVHGTYTDKQMPHAWVVEDDGLLDLTSSDLKDEYHEMARYSARDAMHWYNKSGSPGPWEGCYWRLEGSAVLPVKCDGLES